MKTFIFIDAIAAWWNFLNAANCYNQCLLDYNKTFMEPLPLAMEAFAGKEKEELLSVAQSIGAAKDYSGLAEFIKAIVEQAVKSGLVHHTKLVQAIANQAQDAWLKTLMGEDGINEFSKRLAKIMETAAHTYPEKIRDIESRFGFHFDNGDYDLTAETERFWLYRVKPMGGRAITEGFGLPPVLIKTPYVLGSNILAFLPEERKSYVHAWANLGIPTYVMILKDIQSEIAVQVMTGEDDVLDTKYFCQLLVGKHGLPVTLNGFCQGGFIAACGVMSGKLKGLVNRLITCVAPMDGTRSLAMTEYLKRLPTKFRNLDYALRRLPNGNQVVSGDVMSWVYKLKSMAEEAPLTMMCQDMMNFMKAANNGGIKISPTAAALMHWLKNDRVDLPEGITRISFSSYTIPVDEKGNLPVKLFDRRLNFKDMPDYIDGWQMCLAEKDNLVDFSAALAPFDYIRQEGFIEISVFPNGHGAIATSHSHPNSPFALHAEFETGGRKYRGPIRYYLNNLKKLLPLKICPVISGESFRLGEVSHTVQ